MAIFHTHPISEVLREAQRYAHQSHRGRWVLLPKRCGKRRLTFAEEAGIGYTTLAALNSWNGEKAAWHVRRIDGRWASLPVRTASAWGFDLPAAVKRRGLFCGNPVRFGGARRPGSQSANGVHLSDKSPDPVSAKLNE